MLNRGDISKALEKVIKDGTEGYTVVRNEPRNEDPSMAAMKAWVGVYRGRIRYRKLTTGMTPWIAEIEIDVEVQVASMQDGEDVEDKLEAATNEIIGVITASRNIGGTVQTIKEITIEDELNENDTTYYQAAIITIVAEQRA